MGSCWFKGTSTADIDPGRGASDVGSGISDDPPSLTPSDMLLYSKIPGYIMEVVQLIGNVRQNSEEQPEPLSKIHLIAEEERGWQLVVEALITTVPLCMPLGTSAIAIIFDDCPLPAVKTILDVFLRYKLGSTRAMSCHISADKKCYERNMLVILGCMAEKFAGPISGKLLTQNVLDYLFTFLLDRRAPELVLQSLVTIEKFAKTNDNKAVLLSKFSQQKELNCLIQLERYYSYDFMWRQVRFCARWLLDNLFFVPGRMLSYTLVDMSDKNAILNCKDTTDFLKISPNGLGARSDSHTFESTRCTFKVTGGIWYYEVEVLTPGVMQIGWATKQTKFGSQDGHGIGDDNFSLAYDGCRRLLWHKASPQTCENIKPWVPGDIVGCLIDVGKQEAIFALNGVRLPVCKDIFESTKEGFFAAASFMCFQEAVFNFGADEFRYAPTDREFKIFNEHGRLTEENKQVVPRWLQRQRSMTLEEDGEDFDEDAICAICYDNKSDVILSPCRHKRFCGECAFRLVECPMCREHIWHYTILPL